MPPFVFLYALSALFWNNKIMALQSGLEMFLLHAPTIDSTFSGLDEWLDVYNYNTTIYRVHFAGDIPWLVRY